MKNSQNHIFSQEESRAYWMYEITGNDSYIEYFETEHKERIAAEKEKLSNKIKEKFISREVISDEKNKCSKEYMEFREKKINNEESYKIVPDELIRSSYLNEGEKAIYLAVLSYTDNKTGITFVSDETLGKVIGKKRSTVQSRLSSLEKKKMLTRLTVSSDERYICLRPYPQELYDSMN